MQPELQQAGRAGLPFRSTAAEGSKWAGHGDSFAFPRLVTSMSHTLLSSTKYGK